MHYHCWFLPALEFAPPDYGYFFFACPPGENYALPAFIYG